MQITLTNSQVWNFDSTLAAVIADGLTMLIASDAEQEAGIDKARDTFRAYANRDADDKWFDFDTGPDAERLDEALMWLALNFRSLWD